MGRHRRGAGARATRPAALSGVPDSLRVTRAGPLAAGALASTAGGRVAAVPRRSAILESDDGALLALLPEGTPLHPWALTVAPALPPLAAGAEVGVADGTLRLGPLRLGLAGAEVADLGIHRRPARREAVDWPRLEGPTADGPFEPPLAAALAAFAAGAGAESLAAIVGLGEGLTPSGDDVLIGVLAALDWARDLRPEAAAQRRRLVGALPAALAERTGRFSAQLLRAAANGLYAEPILDLLDAMACGSAAPEALARAIPALLGIGHRSGTDTLRGIVAVLARRDAAAGLPQTPTAG